MTISNPYDLIFEELNGIKDILLELRNESRRDEKSLDNKPFRLQAAADYLGIAKTSLYGLVSKGKIQTLKPGKHLLFTKDCLEAYLRGERPEKPEPTDPSTFLIRNKKAAK